MTLATTDDYEAITGQTADARVSTLLAMAETAVLEAPEAYGQAIAETTYTDVDLYPVEGVLYLPQRPVSDVISVATVDANGTVTALTEGTDYRWTRGGNGRPAEIRRIRFGHDHWWGASTSDLALPPVGQVKVRVTYAAGWATIPGSVVAMQVAMVKSVVDNSGGQAPTQRTVGPFSASFDPAEVRKAMVLTPSDRETLRGLCGVKAPTSVPVALAAP